MDIIKQTESTYNNLAAQYADHWFDFSMAADMDKFCAFLKPDSLILDLGCGPGRDMAAFEQRGFRTIGLDRSAAMLKQAARRGAKSLVQADMRRLPFANQSVNAIWAVASLLHLPKNQLPAALADINRTLDHGHVFISVKEGQAETWRNDGENGQRFFAYYHPAEIELALERAHFHVLRAAVTPDSKGRAHRWISAIGWTRLDTPKVGANAVIFNETGQVLLTRRSDNGLWCVPGGHLDMGEKIETAAVREAFEETGLTVEIMEQSGMYTATYSAHLFPEGKARHFFIVAFLCRVTGGQLTLNEEVTEFGWFDPAQLPPDLISHHAQRILDAADMLKQY